MIESTAPVCWCDRYAQFGTKCEPCQAAALRAELARVTSERDTWKQLHDGVQQDYTNRDMQRIILERQVADLSAALRVAIRWIVEDGAEIGWSVDRLREVLAAPDQPTRGEGD